jgi:hypothetical protein
MTKVDHLTLWKCAVPLQRAYMEFAPKDLLARLSDLKRQTAAPAITDRMGKLATTDAFQEMNLGERFAALPAILGPMDELRRLTTELQTHCVQLIHSGKVLALGYAVPRGLADMPAPVPNDMWQQLVNWESGTVSGHGLRIGDIRLAVVKAIPSERLPLAAPSTMAPEMRSQGRPSRETEVTTCFETLHASGQIDPSRPRIFYHDVIRKMIDPSFTAKTPGLSRNCMQRILKPYFDALDGDPKLKKP